MLGDLLKKPIRLSRRRAMLAGGAAVAGVAGVAISARPRSRNISFLKGVDLTRARPIGDGFYIVDGWVLTERDLERLGAKTAGRAKK